MTGKAPVCCTTQSAIPFDGVPPGRLLLAGWLPARPVRATNGLLPAPRRAPGSAGRGGRPRRTIARAPPGSRSAPGHALSSAHACRPAAPHIATPTEAPSAWLPLVSEGPFHSRGVLNGARSIVTRTQPDLTG